MMEEDEDEFGDFKTRRRAFLKAQLASINKNYSSKWQRKIMSAVAGLEAKVRHRKIPLLENPVAGTMYVGDKRFTGEAFFYFKVEHPVRRGAIRVITDSWYMKFSTVLLIVHIIPAIVAEPGVPRHRFADFLPEMTAWLLLLADRVLILYFAIELGITFLAYGFLRTCANAFRLIDVISVFIAVCVDAIPYDANDGQTAKYFIALNSLRVFRIVGRIEGMRKLMLVLVSCIPTLVDVLMLLGTLVFSFSIVGLTFFRQNQHNRCISQDLSEVTHTCTPASLDIPGGQRCETGFNCTMNLPPTSEIGNFDTVWNAFFSILQLLCMDDWYVIGAEVMNGGSPFSFVYFAAGVILGAFWAMNLILAVVTDAFSRFHANEKKIKSRKKREKQEEEEELQSLLTEKKKGGDGNNKNQNNEGGDDNDNNNNNNEYDDNASSLGGKSMREEPLLGKQRKGGGGFSTASRASSGGDHTGGSETDSNYYDEDHEYSALTGGHTKGTHPWFKRKLQMWMRNLSAASTASLLAGIQTVDVRSLIEGETGGTHRTGHPHSHPHHQHQHDGQQHHNNHPHHSQYHHPDTKVNATAAATAAAGGGGGGVGEGGENGNFEATGLFDDSDLVEMAAHANMMGAQQAARYTRDEGTKRSSVGQKMHSIEAWARSMPAADELSVVPDDDAHWDIKEDDMYDPQLVVPGASDEVGTRGKIFYPKAAFRPLSLFDRYQLAAEKANKNEIPEDQESEDDVDLGFVDEKSMSLAKVKRQLAKKRRRVMGAINSKNNPFASKEKTALVGVEEPSLKEQFYDWLETIQASSKSVPFNVLVRMIHQSTFFQRLITSTIILTAILLSLNYYGAPDGLVITINVFTAFNDLVVVFDMVMILYYQGWFSRNKAERQPLSAATLIDIGVGILSLVDLIFVVPGFGRALRGIRGVRLLKLAKNFTLLHDLIQKMKSSSYYFASLLGIALCFVLAFATIGRHVFDGWVPAVQNCYIQNYDFTCNTLPDCVFVTSTEWLDSSVVLGDLQDRVFIPAALNTTTALELDVYRNNATLLNETPVVAAYFGVIAPYSCRQFRNWGEAAPTDRLTFNSPADAFLTIFNAITKDNFSAVMYRFMEVSPATSLMFLFVLFFGSYLLISLLVSILLVHFSDLQVSTDDDKKKKNDNNNNNNNPNNSLMLDGPGGEAAAFAEIDAMEKAKEEAAVAAAAAAAERQESDEEDPETWASRPALGGITHPPSNIATQRVAMDPIPEDASWQKRFSIKGRFYAKKLLLSICDVADPLVHRANLKGDSFLMFSPTSSLRLTCCDLISGKYFPFEQTIVLSALIHMVTTFIIGDESFSNQGGMAIILTIDLSLVSLSIADLLARCIAQGAVLGDYSFWKARAENKLDSITICCSLIAAVYRLVRGKTMFGIVPDMFFRSLRPMRVVIRSRGMKNVALAVRKTMPAMGKVVGLAAALIWMLGLMCVEYFGGSLRTCSDGSDRSEAECFGNFQQRGLQIVGGEQITVIFNQTRRFRNPDEYNFDNIFYGFSALTQLAVASQWTNVVFSLADSPDEPGGMPIRDNRKWTVALVMAWVVIGNFVLLNIFVGTIVDNFSRFKLKLAGALFKTPEEVEFNQIQMMLKQTRVKKALSVPEIPFLHRRLNEICFLVATSTPFLYWTRLVTLFDMVAIATLHYDMSDNWMNFQEAATRAISVALWIEVFLKAGISGPQPYFKIWFNRIDFVMACVVGAESLTYIFWDSYREKPFLHTARIVSSFRLVREVKSFRSLLKSGLRALPAMSNIGALVFLVFFMASFFSMGFFQNVRTIIHSSGGVNLDHSMNFKTIPRAMIAMFNVATLDNWGDVMQAAGAEPPKCQKGLDCGEPIVCNIFFVFYVILVGFIMINLFITVVLENFSESVLVPAYITERLRDVNAFRSLWVNFDPSGRQVIGAKQFIELLMKLPGPRFRLGRLRGDIEAGDNVSECSWASEEKERYAAHSAVGLMGEPQAAVIPSLRDLKVPITMPDQEILFGDALDVIGEKIFHISLLDSASQAVKTQVHQSAKEYSSNYFIAHYYAASRIQKFVKETWLRAQQPPQLYKSTILWDQILKPLFIQRWKHNAETIFKTETAEEASVFRKLTLTRGLGGGGGGGGGDDDKNKDGDNKGDPSSPASEKSGKGKRKRASSPRRGGKKNKGGGGGGASESDGDGFGASSRKSESGKGGKGDEDEKREIRPLLHMKIALGSIMEDVEEEVEEDTSWMLSVTEVESTGSSWADDEGEEAWLPQSAISGERTIRSVGVAPECRRHGGVFELVSVAELIARKRREREFLAHFAPAVRQRLQNMPPRTRSKFKPTPMPQSRLLGELIDQGGAGKRNLRAAAAAAAAASASNASSGGGGGKSTNFDTSGMLCGFKLPTQDDEEDNSYNRNRGETTTTTSGGGENSSTTGDLFGDNNNKDNNKNKNLVAKKQPVYLSQIESAKPPSARPMGIYGNASRTVKNINDNPERVAKQQERMGKALSLFGSGTSGALLAATRFKRGLSTNTPPSSSSSPNSTRVNVPFSEDSKKKSSTGVGVANNRYEPDADLDLDLDDALLELEKKVEQDRLRQASRLSTVSQIRSSSPSRSRPSATNTTQQQQQQQQQQNKKAGWYMPPSVSGLKESQQKSGADNNSSKNINNNNNDGDDDEILDPTSCSMAAIRRSVFESNHLRGVNAQQTSNLLAQTAEAAQNISFGPKWDTDIELPEKTQKEIEEEQEALRKKKKREEGGILSADELELGGDQKQQQQNTSSSSAPATAASSSSSSSASASATATTQPQSKEDQLDNLAPPTGKVGFLSGGSSRERAQMQHEQQQKQQQQQQQAGESSSSSSSSSAKEKKDIFGDEKSQKQPQQTGGEGGEGEKKEKKPATSLFKRAIELAKKKKDGGK